MNFIKSNIIIRIFFFLTANILNSIILELYLKDSLKSNPSKIMSEKLFTLKSIAALSHNCGQ